MASGVMGPAPSMRTPPPGVMGQEPAGQPGAQAQMPAGRDGNSLAKVAQLLQALRVAPPQEFITAVRALGQGIQQIAQDKVPQMQAAAQQQQAGAGAGPGGPPPMGAPGAGAPPSPAGPPMGRPMA